MSLRYENGGRRHPPGGEVSKPNFTFFETLNGIWNLNHCYARINIISAYCMFLLKRAYHYKADFNRASTADFVKEQFREMVKYKEQIVEIERQVFEESIPTKDYLKEEIERLTVKLKADLDHRFRLVAEKVGEKIPGEPVANALVMANDEVESLLIDEYQSHRPW